MKGKIKIKFVRWISIFLAIVFVFCENSFFLQAKEEQNQSLDTSLSAESAVLMEASTGTILYEKNPNDEKPPASVTKIMTLLLIFEALDSGKIKKEDIVTISEHAASMGGSQVFLEVGEQQTVDTLIKCISVSSANDASVAMGELIGGSEENFVSMMNQRAKELKMEHTHFVNCCGLDVKGHVTTAKDIALMSRELTANHPEIFDYTTIWMDEFTHKTAKGESVFGLSNTNKLLKNYNGCTGLKTGSTGLAKFCLSATATRNHIDLIAVVMACPDSKQRMKDAAALLNYGFANVTMYSDTKETKIKLPTVKVKGGRKDCISLVQKDDFHYISTKGEDFSKIKRKLNLPEHVNAPVQKGEAIGTIEYELGGKNIGSSKLISLSTVKTKSFPTSFKKIWKEWASI